MIDTDSLDEKEKAIVEEIVPNSEDFFGFGWISFRGSDDVQLDGNYDLETLEKIVEILKRLKE